MTNSRETAKRIKKFYGREATVIYPPISLKPVASSQEQETNDSQLMTNDYFLVVSRLVEYKRIDLAIEVANRLALPLKIVGVGREEGRLKKLAGPTVEFLGLVSDERLSELYRNCQAFIFPGMEDFGITPVEAMSFGKPVIALGEGGVLETVRPGRTGTFFAQETVESLVEALESFDPKDYKPKDCIAQAKKFSKERFQKEFRNFVNEKLKLM